MIIIDDIKRIPGAFEEKNCVIKCNAIDEEEIIRVLELKLKYKKHCALSYEVKTLEDGKYSITVCNRLEIPLIIQVNSLELFSRLFEFWVKETQLSIPVYPFPIIVQMYAAFALGKELDFSVVDDDLFQYGLRVVKPDMIAHGMKLLREENILAGFFDLLSDTLHVDFNLEKLTPVGFSCLPVIQKNLGNATTG